MKGKGHGALQGKTEPECPSGLRVDVLSGLLSQPDLILVGEH